jgi:glycosyltransferase involved in cell wall biosynthesis
VCPGSALLRGIQTCEKCASGHFWHGAVGGCRSGELARSLGAACECYMARAMGVLKEIDCYVAPSEFLARKVVEMGLPARRIEVVPNPVKCPDNPSAVEERDGLLFVGRLSPEKGVDCLVKAVAAQGGVGLDVLGDGPSLGELKELSIRLEADVRFHGWADADVVRAYMAKAELLCVPSIGYENCPGVVLEAMAGGLPVLASDLGGLTELLDGGRVGWLAPAGNVEAWRTAIREATTNRAESNGRAELASSWVRHRHDPDLFAERLEQIYSSLIGNREQ